MVPIGLDEAQMEPILYTGTRGLLEHPRAISAYTTLQIFRKDKLSNDQKAEDHKVSCFSFHEVNYKSIKTILSQGISSKLPSGYAVTHKKPFQSE